MIGLLAAEWGVGQVFWSMLWFFLFVLWIWLIFVILTDIFRSNDLSGLAKTIWVIVIIFVPYLGIFAYLIARGSGMTARQSNRSHAENAATQAYIRENAGYPTGDAAKANVIS